MSEDLRQQLRSLEAEYAGQPRVAQQTDLRLINHIRSQLGMPPVDAHLKEIGVAAPVEAARELEPEIVPDHSEARALYETYLKKVEELKVHRAYADRVARATAGTSQTPVRPLATLGTGGGPLLCDHCRKPIVLEGGRHHGKTADVAWEQNSDEDWNSYILGGMVVEIQTNGTLRIYHGYPGQDPKHCCNVAHREAKKARGRKKSRAMSENFHPILAFLEDEFPDMPQEERLALLNEVLNTLDPSDPGIGINRPDAECLSRHSGVDGGGTVG